MCLLTYVWRFSSGVRWSRSLFLEQELGIARVQRSGGRQVCVAGGCHTIQRLGRRPTRPQATLDHSTPNRPPTTKKNAYSTTKRKYLCLIIASILSTKCTSRLTFLIYQEIKQHFIILISLNFLGCCDC